MLTKQRRWVENELKRAKHIKEANERLDEDLQTREMKVKEMESAQEERHVLAQAVTSDSSTAEEKEALIEELNDRIESLEMQIELDTDRIESTQEDMENQGLIAEGGGADTQAEIVDKFDELEEAKAALKAMFETVEQFQLIDALSKAEMARVMVDQSERDELIKDLQTRLLLAEKEYDTRCTELQREHEARLLVMLGEVETTHKESGKKAAHVAESPSKLKAPTAESPTTANKENPAAAAAASEDAEKLERMERMERLLSVKEEQNSILQEQHDYYQDMGTEMRNRLEEAEEGQTLAMEEASQAKQEAEDLTAQIAKLTTELETGRGGGRGRSHTVEAALSGLELDDADREALLATEATVSRLVNADGAEGGSIGSYLQSNLSELESLWSNIGLPREEQTRLRGDMIRPVVKLCESETSRNKQHEMELAEEREELEAMMASQDDSFQSELQTQLTRGSSQEPPGQPMALWEAVNYLRDQGHRLLKDSLEELKAAITATAPSKGKKIKWRVRWQSDPIDGEILNGTLRPSRSAFDRLSSRKAEVSVMAEEARKALGEYTLELEEQWLVLETGAQAQEAVLSTASRGGFNAVHDIEKVVEEAKAEVRLKLRSERVKLSELWIEVSIRRALS